MKIDAMPTRGTTADVEQLLARRDEFVLASTNVDEDLHFSSLYLESTMRPPKEVEGLTGWYSELAAFNYQAVERYYLLTRECKAVSEQLTDAVIRDPNMLVRLLAEIDRRSGLLDEVFPFGWTDSVDTGADIEQLGSLYVRHLETHRHLYAVARIPEALDRGTGRFTEILKQRLEKCLPEGVIDDSADPLSVVSTIGKPTVFRQEQVDFLSVLRSLTGHEREAVGAARTGALALMVLSPRSRGELTRHRARWSPLYYHGYGVRDGLALSELAGRLRQVIAKGDDFLVPATPQPALRDAVLDACDFDERWKTIFFAYGLLGWTKARRRWFQLKNFQRLDRLLELLADRLSCAEWDLRVLTPPEILAWIQTGVRPRAIIEERYVGAAMIYRDGVSLIAPIESQIDLDRPLRQGSVIAGETVVPGVVRGRAILTTRGGSHPDEIDGRSTAVLVLAQLDSDVVWTLPFFDALVVEESGANAHVSIIARELGIPTVASATGATRLIEPGQLVTVNATEGRITLDDDPSDHSST